MVNYLRQMKEMKGILTHPFIVSIGIGASYFLLWALAIFISENSRTAEFLTSYGYTCWQNLYVLLVNILIFHVLLPFVKGKKNKTGKIILSVVLVSVLLSIGYPLWLKLGMRTGTYPASERTIMDSGYIIRTIIYQLYGIAYFTTIQLLLHNSKLNNRNHQLQLEKKTAELNYLKSQTNPHFLFNTLNNIYSLAKDKSDLTADSVLRLSNILRYMLYGAEAPLVTIDKEISILKEYIELEKMRYDASLAIRLHMDIDHNKQQIPPLFMIPLVENAFKHGISETIGHSFITIHITVKESTLLFVVENSKSRKTAEEKIRESIGITNLRRQLNLQFKDHRLDIQNKENSFLVSMYINLNSYAAL